MKSARLWNILVFISLSLLTIVPVEAKRIQVANVEELYAAVNDPANENTDIVLAGGVTYSLSASDVLNNARPNGGRLELPKGASLRGANSYLKDMEPRPSAVSGDVVFADPDTESIIDAAGLPLASFRLATGMSGVLRIGRNNTVSNLTIRNNQFALSLVEIGLLPEHGGMSATVSDCIIESGVMGVDFRHFSTAASGRASRATIERNIIRHQGGRFGFGIRLIANNFVQGSTLRAKIAGNRVYGNVYGLHAEALGSSDHRIEIDSRDNIYEGNVTGVGLEGGVAAAQRNRLRFESQNDAIWSNSGVGTAFQVPGGLVARAGVNSGTIVESSNNSLQVTLRRARLVKRNPDGTRAVRQNGTLNGARRDVAVYGAHGTTGVFRGTGNRVELTLCAADSDDAFGVERPFIAIDVAPADSATTPDADPNRAVLLGANVAFVNGAGAPVFAAPGDDFECGDE